MALIVLFLDDDVIQNDVMQEFVQHSSVPIDACFFTQGSEVLKYLNNCDPINLPHVLFIDIYMPDMNGWEVINQLAHYKKEADWLPSIYVLTSSVSNKNKELAAQHAHLKAYLSKPLSEEDFGRIIQHEYSALI